MEALTLRWESDSTGKGERILNPALAAGKDAMWSVMQDGAASIPMRAEIDAGLGRMQALIRSARRIALIGMVASCFTLLAAAIMLWAIVEWTRLGNVLAHFPIADCFGSKRIHVDYFGHHHDSFDFFAAMQHH